MRAADDLTGLVGGTPLLRLARFAPGAEVYGKCEFLNPYSVKDRPVLAMLRAAAADGRLPPGGTVVEATSGNTGIAVASQAAVLGYRAVLVMSDLVSRERRQVLAALGAEVVITPAAEGTRGARDRAKQIAEERGAFYLCQHHNPANPLAHAETTARELWEDTEGRIDVLVAGAGTTGTLTGVARALESLKPSFRAIGVEPESAPFLKCDGAWAPHHMLGTAPGFLPEVYDPDLVEEIVLVSEEDSFAACRELARKEGLLVGITSGATALAARRLAAREDLEGAVLVCVLADPGERYLSMGVFEGPPDA